MIVSHQLKCIFIAIPKTATHAIRYGLRPYLGPEDDEQVALFVHKKSSYPGISGFENGHVSAAQIRESVGEEIWQSYFKFAFVRNPFDRFISNCAFLYRNQPDFKQNLRIYINKLLTDGRFKERIWFTPQHHFVCDDEENLMLDFIGRFENLEEDFDRICTQLKISNDPLDRINGSIHNHYADYFDEELLALVRGIYSKDFSLFQYPSNITH